MGFSLRIVAFLILLSGCTELAITDNDRAYIAPLAGQSGLALESSLMVRTGGERLPTDLGLPSLIAVADAEGNPVSGSLTVDRDALLFTPDQPWESDATYTWSLVQPDQRGHVLQVRLPEHLLGTATFTTSQTLRPLAASFDEVTRETCIVFSRSFTFDDRELILLSVDGSRLDDAVIRLTPEQDWLLPYPLLPGDLGVDILCTDPDVLTGPNVQLEVQRGTEPPWTLEVTDQPIGDVITTLRRGNY